MRRAALHPTAGTPKRSERTCSASAKSLLSAAALAVLISGPITAAPAAAASFPDLVISHATVAMKCLADGTRTATIFVIVKNQGAGPADLSKDPWRIVIDADWGWSRGNGSKPATVLPQAGGPQQLKAGGIFPATMTIPGMKAPPRRKTKEVESYVFTLRADPRKIVAESREDNNVKNLYIVVGEECD